MTDARAARGQTGTPNRCVICEWLLRQRASTTDALQRRGLVDADIRHRQTMHPEGPK